MPTRRSLCFIIKSSGFFPVRNFKEPISFQHVTKSDALFDALLRNLKRPRIASAPKKASHSCPPREKEKECKVCGLVPIATFNVSYSRPRPHFLTFFFSYSYRNLSHRLKLGDGPK